MSDIGEAVRAARQERGWTQAELAKRAGVDVKTVGRLERGEVGNPAKSGQVEKVLQIGIYAPAEPEYRPRYDPPLSEATFTELLAALLDRYNQRHNQPVDGLDGVRFRARDALPQHVQRALDAERRADATGKPSGGNTGG